ncbi:hypothetical protein KFL_006640060 [Klebsormidium nitens]|uniref:NAD(P)-binding Rossmann-fold superfamily protein n=1 Tax=Klebsormidium nitens TaxID=105231 RepID=A0A1Y1IPB8_KLENI|nr:hypothetical protein KFL_006640060 [Klebsormidium nitens]|eukprot:GAQ90626.1 hypothetical protein KFL_006640060 [Klebsormidium nitens]
MTRRSACVAFNAAVLAACLGPVSPLNASPLSGDDPDQALDQRAGGSVGEESSAGPYVRSHERHVVITGGNSGIGKATAVALAGMGMHITLACRNQARGNAAAADISEKTGNDSVRSMLCDLASLRSVREFAENYQKTGRPLDVLVNNAGIMACPQMFTEDGFEMQLGVNHMGHFLLTSLLLGTLASSATPGRRTRVVNVSSQAHQLGSIDFDDLNFQGKRKYGRWEAYAQSKLANILFTKELTRRCAERQVPIDANALHPGVVDTQLVRYLLPAQLLEARDKDPTKSSAFAKFIGLRTPEEGSSTVVYLASSPYVEGVSGGYYDDSKPAEPSKLAKDPDLASRLWTVSQELTSAPDFETSLSVPTKTALWLLPT